MSVTTSDLGEGAVPASDGPGATHYTRLGISLSGGGIRSATFGLGMCQHLDEARILHRARYLSAVSGGSYLAAGLAISHALCPEDLRDERPRAWGRGSPEEARLRRNLNYLAPEASGRLWMFANVLYGLLLNLIPLVLGAFLLGRVAGLVLRWMYPGLGSGRQITVSALPWVFLTSLLLVLASVTVVGRRRFLDKHRLRRRLRTDRSERAVTWLLGGAAATLLLGVVLPGMLDFQARLTAGHVVSTVGLGDVNFALRRLILGVAAVSVAAGLGVVALLMLHRRLLRWLRGLFAGLAGGTILLAPFVVAAGSVTVRGWSPNTDVPASAAAIVVILAFALLAHNRRYSMHLFYCERIHEAFASRREKVDGQVEAQRIPYEQPVRLSDIARLNAERSRWAGGSFPELILCASVAARGDEVPNKTWAASFTFEGERSGNERLKLDAATRKFEAGAGIGGGDLTLPAIMAISGAAISPIMGRFTLPAFRFLMAVLNIRLGVWIPNPNRPSPVPIGKSWAGKLREYVLRKWFEPGAWYVLKEGLGIVDAHGRYIYVTDGGHWENLGLTELLRRRCTHVVVVDASGDPSLADVGRAMAVARAELGVEFKLDPRVTRPGKDDLADTPVAVGTFKYADGQVGDIFYARSVLWKHAPSDLHLLATHESRFPNHPTSNQFLSGDLFDAYRALGWAVAEELTAVLSLPPEKYDEPRPSATRRPRG